MTKTAWVVVVLALGGWGCGRPGTPSFRDDFAGSQFDGGGGGAGGAGGSCGATGTETETPHEPPGSAPALTGGHLATADDGTFVVADPDRAVLWHLDRSTVLGRIELSSDDLPGRVATAGRRAWVVLRRAGQLGELDLDTHAFTRHATCVEPRALLIRGGDSPLVGCADGTVEAFSAAGERSVYLHDEGLADLRDLVFDGSRLLASTFRDALVFEVSRGGAVPLSNPVLPADSAGAVRVPRVAWRMRDGLVAAQDEQISSVFLASCSAYGGSGHGPIVRSTLYEVDGGSLGLAQGLDEVVLPVDVAKVGSTVFVASAGTNVLFRLDRQGNRSQRPLPGAPTSLSTTAAGEVAVFVREPAQLIVFGEDGALVSVNHLAAASVASTGFDLFHRSTANRIACASCHPEAGDDGHVWSFVPGGPRRTPPLRGGLSATAPFHWDGSERDMAQLVANVMGGRMGGPAQTPERTAALLAWLDQQPKQRSPALDAAEVERGRLLFESAQTGCASCHVGPDGTNNASADVGTGGAFQVPRLVELAWRTRLLHDGSLARLEDRVSASSTSHGDVSQLSETERRELLAYLRSR